MARLIVMLVSWIAFRLLGAAGMWTAASSWTTALRFALAVMFVFTAASHLVPRTRRDLVRMVPPTRRESIVAGRRATPLAGVGFLAVGLLLFGASLWYFAARGRGTLAPWDPPRSLVVDGPYRYVRNPMIAGVLFLVFGEALVLLSRPHAVWALFFLCLNAVYIPLLEEPLLERRFGEPYREYCRHVRRFIPRARPRVSV